MGGIHARLAQFNKCPIVVWNQVCLSRVKFCVSFTVLSSGCLLKCSLQRRGCVYPHVDWWFGLLWYWGWLVGWGTDLSEAGCVIAWPVIYSVHEEPAVGWWTNLCQIKSIHSSYVIVKCVLLSGLRHQTILGKNSGGSSSSSACQFNIPIQTRFITI